MAGVIVRDADGEPFVLKDLSVNNTASIVAKGVGRISVTSSIRLTPKQLKQLGSLVNGFASDPAFGEPPSVVLLSDEQMVIARRVSLFTTAGLGEYELYFHSRNGVLYLGGAREATGGSPTGNTAFAREVFERCDNFLAQQKKVAIDKVGTQERTSRPTKTSSNWEVPMTSQLRRALRKSGVPEEVDAIAVYCLETYKRYLGIRTGGALEQLEKSLEAASGTVSRLQQQLELAMETRAWSDVAKIAPEIEEAEVFVVECSAQLAEARNPLQLSKDVFAARNWLELKALAVQGALVDPTESNVVAGFEQLAMSAKKSAARSQQAARAVVSYEWLAAEANVVLSIESCFADRNLA